MNAIASNEPGKPSVTISATTDFQTCFMNIFTKYISPVTVIVSNAYQYCDNRIMKTLESSSKSIDVKNTIKPVRAVSYMIKKNSDTDVENDGDALEIIAIYDTQKRLAEIKITNFQQKTIPSVIIELIAFALTNFQHLNKFTIKNCCIDMSVVHELSKILSCSTITDVCLDDCPLKEANYDELLKYSLSLKNLSLCRCKINYEMCKRIASKLHFLEPAEKTLVALNLTSNCIGDEGVKYFAEALRTNRHLRYLNLADNDISDDGASLIFNKCTEFPLTYDENMGRRHRFLSYLKNKLDIYVKFLHTRTLDVPNKSPVGSIRNKTRKIQAGPLNKNRKLSSRRQSFSSNEDNMPIKAELIATDLVGPFEDPFCAANVRIVAGGYPRCIGNLVLSYLNIAYNNLTYTSVKKLLSAVEYQNVHGSPTACGLLKVVLEGNSLPAICPEFITIQNILNTHSKFSKKIT